MPWLIHYQQMVTVTLRKTAWGYDAMKAEEHAGDPIICASVSAIMQGLCGTLLNMDPKPDIHKMVIRDGYVEVEVSPMIEDQDRRVLDMVFTFAVVSIMQIEKKYPKNVQVFTK